MSAPRPAPIAMPPGATDTQTHMYLPGFPALPGGPPNPEDPLPTPARYRAVMARLGVSRVVITQGNAQQLDNANLLACLAEMGDAARGVAAIPGDADDRLMTRLSDGGCVGARIMDLPGGAVTLDALEAVDARAAAYGWTLAVQFDGDRIEEHAPRLSRLRSRWILDHHGKFFGGAAPGDAKIDAALRLIDGGRCWFKFAACYESSRAGPPDYEDVGAVARVVAAHAPERIVWGTNWPHNLVRGTPACPDDLALRDLVLGWLPSDEARRQALTESPRTLFGFPPA